jgi:isopentenyl diphosphate isomerase/L-lactate dehydrogenase-like FMN-dependent dehydrogenase
VSSAQFQKSYGSFRSEVLRKALTGAPRVTTDPNYLEEQARGKMTAQGYGFLAGGAGERATMDANRLAFRQWKIVQRVLRPGGARDLSVSLFGRTFPTPILFSPIGFQHLFHADAEPGVAQIASELGVPFVMSQNSGASVEQVAQANGNGERWYQLYWSSSDALTVAQLNRAKKAGFRVLVVTLDLATTGWRPWDMDQGFTPTNYRGATPSANLTGRSTAPANESAESTESAEFADFAEGAAAAAPSWDHLRFLRANWPGPIVLKGVQHADDARMAADAGMDGVIVSNHGGRQLDGAIGSLDALPEIVDAAGARLTVLFDSGVRTGADVIKALALGARGVLVGRPWAYGLGIAGKDGAKQVMQGVLAQIEINMSIAGIGSVADMRREILRRSTGGGGEKSSSN